MLTNQETNPRSIPSHPPIPKETQHNTTQCSAKKHHERNRPRKNSIDRNVDQKFENKNPPSRLTSNSQLSHQITRDIQERIRTRDLLLLVPYPLANRPPLTPRSIRASARPSALITHNPNNVLIPVALEIDHERSRFKLVQLDVEEHPHAVLQILGMRHVVRGV